MSNPCDILQRMPATAVSPALLEVIELLSGPILLIEDGSRGELKEMAAAAPLALAA